MALNCSSCSILPTSIIHADDGSCGSRCSRSQFDGGNAYGYGGAIGGSVDTDVYDPAEFLPADPFGMHIGSDIEAAIAGLMDFGVSSYGYDVSSDQLIACCYWNEALIWTEGTQLDGFWDLDPYMDESLSGLSVYDTDDDGFFESLSDDGQPLSSVGPEASCSDRNAGQPHDGLQYVLSFLGARDLLSVERVCKFLHSAVTGDPFLWKCIHIDSSLAQKITDDSLWQLTQRAQGNLECLDLACCYNITDDGLKRVLEHNPKLEKLCVAGCVRLSLEGIIKNLKTFQSSSTSGIKQLKLGGLFSISEELYRELQLLLGEDHLQEIKFLKPQFYHTCGFSLACDDERYLDIEKCPVCQKFKLVFDCPSENCHAEEGSSHCRACQVCIPRCVQCGECIKDDMYVETFFLEHLCPGCWKQSPLGSETDEEN